MMLQIELGGVYIMARNKRTQLDFKEAQAENKKKAVGYIRVSTEKQDISPEAQKEKIISYCKAKEIELIDIYEDIAISGTTKPVEREGFKKAYDDVQDGKANIFIVTKNDRIARRATYQKDIIYSLVDDGNEYISISENVDTNSATGKLFLSMLAEFSEYEVELIKERTKTALKHLKDSGQAYNKSKTGYKKIGSKKDGDKVATFVVDETEQKMIKDIIKYYDAGDSWRKVTTRINKKYKKDYRPNSLRRVYIREKQALVQL